MSGAHSEPPWARVEIKLKMSFQALSHSPSHERALALTSPPPRLFVHFHTTMPTSPPNPSSIHQVESIQSVGSVGSIASIHPQKSNIPYWYCLQCTPSLTLPPSSLKCLQKSNPGIHRKCFRCFKCFGCFRCFISLLDYKTARFWSKSEQTRKIATHLPPSSNGYGKHPKRQFTHLSTN